MQHMSSLVLAADLPDIHWTYTKKIDRKFASGGKGGLSILQYNGLGGKGKGETHVVVDDVCVYHFGNTYNRLLIDKYSIDTSLISCEEYGLKGEELRLGFVKSVMTASHVTVTKRQKEKEG